MIIQKFNIPFPSGGLGQFLLNKDKGNGLTQDAENVVGESPITGKLQGGQRPGLSKLTSAEFKAGEPIQVGISVAHDRSAFTHRQLGAPLNDPNPIAITEDWSKKAPQVNGSLDARIDSHGNQYWLTETGEIVKRNSAGEDVWTAALPITAGLVVAPRFALLEDGAVLAAGNSIDGTEECVLWRMQEDEFGKGLFIGFTLQLEATTVEAIEVSGATAKVAVNGNNRLAEILTVLGVNGSEPAIIHRHVVPYPVGDLTIGPRGVYSCSRPDPNRGPEPAGEGFSESVVDWTPFDLLEGSERIHAWWDPDFAVGSVDGSRVTIWPDYRLSGDFGTPFDSTDRRLGKVEFRGENHNRGPVGPRWRRRVVGPHAGLVFESTAGGVRLNSPVGYDGGTGLQAKSSEVGQSSARQNKINPQAELPASRGFWPLTNGHKFVSTIVVRWKLGAPPGAVWIGGAYPGRDLNPGTKYLAITINDDGATTAGQQNGHVAIRTGSGVIAHGQATSHGPDPLRMAIITIVQNGPTGFSIRVNGTEILSGSTFDDSDWPNAHEFFGHRIFLDSGFPTRYLAPEVDPVTGPIPGFLENIDSLNGVIAGGLVVFGASGPGVHDVDVSLAEVQKIEGMLAHRFGCAADALDPAHPWKGAPPGGSGSTPVTQESAIALRSPYGILMKLSPNGQGATWAIDGAGIGYSLASDDEGGIFSVGPRSVERGYPEERLGPLSRTRMKVIDRGVSVDWEEPSIGRIRFSGTPQDGDYFTINDGVSEKTFEFQANGIPTISGAIAVDPGSGNSWGHATVSAQAIVLATPISCDADLQGDQEASSVDLVIFSRLDATATIRPIIISATAGAFSVVSDMSGPGTYPADAWQGRSRADFDPKYKHMRMAVDFEGDLYVPFAFDTKSNHLVKYFGASGFERFTHHVGGAASAFDVHAVIVDPDEENLYPARGPEFAWVASSNRLGSGAVLEEQGTQTKIRLVESTPRNGPSGLNSTIVVAGGDVFTAEKGQAPALLGAGEFDSSSTWIQAFTLFGEVFIVDNGKYRVVDLARKTLKEWKPKTAGEMPEGARLAVSYRSRAVLARTKKDPFGLYASAHGDPYDFDAERSINGDPLGAFVGTKNRRNPDTVQALAPFFDDALVVGGTSSIMVFRGDLSTLGSINLFTTSTGMAFGDSWAIDPAGFLYFFGSAGGVFVMQPEADGRATPPLELTEHTVAKEMANVDLAKWRPRLVWDAERNGLHVFMVYVGEDPITDRKRHWFFDKARKAWWPARFNQALGEVTCAWAQRGDILDDRVTALGFTDGWARHLDDKAPWDDGEVIHSYVLLGPFSSTNNDIGLVSIQLATSRKGGEVNWQTYASDDPEELGMPLSNGTVQPGFSGTVSVSGKGAAIWLRLSGSALDESWAVGEIQIKYKNQGIRHSQEGN